MGRRRHAGVRRCRDRHVLKRCRGEPASTLAPALVAVAYLAFGAWALVHSNYDPFFFIFIVPGVLLARASTGR